MRKELLIGCGYRKVKQIRMNNDNPEFENLVTLDVNTNCNPDVLWDLRNHPLPFPDNEFDEIHAYDVLEHLAYQGDHEFFFAEFNEYYRISKHKGVFCGSVPDNLSPTCFGDPSHKRVIVNENFTFLDKEQYKIQLGTNKMSDFSDLCKCNFKRVMTEKKKNTFYFCLLAWKEGEA